MKHLLVCRQVFSFMQRRGWLLLLIILLLTGCGKKTLVENTTQKRAMQIVVALYRHGLSATTERESGGQGKYSVKIDENSYAQALAAIEREGLLDEPAPSFEELTASSGFFPASREVEALRMDHALATEIKHVLEQMPGIEHAQVLVRKRFGSKEETIPSVSIVLRTANKASVDQNAVTELALRSVPGLTSERIFLSIEGSVLTSDIQGSAGALNNQGQISYVPLVPFVFNWRVPKDDYTGFALLFLGCMFMIGVLSVLFGYTLGQVRGRRQRTADTTDLVSTHTRIDRTRRDLLDS